MQHVSCVVATGAVFLGFVSQLIRHPYNVPTVCGAVFTHHTLARRLLERNISRQSLRTTLASVTNGVGDVTRAWVKADHAGSPPLDEIMS